MNAILTLTPEQRNFILNDMASFDFMVGDDWIRERDNRRVRTQFKPWTGNVARRVYVNVTFMNGGGKESSYLNADDPSDLTLQFDSEAAKNAVLEIIEERMNITPEQQAIAAETTRAEAEKSFEGW
jgi:hypothetical protein